MSRTFGLTHCQLEAKEQDINNTIQLYLILSSFQSSEVHNTTEHRRCRAIVCEGLGRGPYTVTASGEAQTLYPLRYRPSTLTNRHLLIGSATTRLQTIRLTAFRLQVYLYPLRLINRGRFLIVSLKRAIYPQDSSF